MESDPGVERWLELARDEWDSRADRFDQLSARNAAGDDRRAELDFVTDALAVGPGARVLDAGCGPGYFAIALAGRGYLVDGVDISPEMIERARSNAERAGVRVAFEIGELGALTAPDGLYDAIVARMVLQFSPHVSTVLDEFERVSRPRARCWLSVPGPLAPMYQDSWQRFVSPELPPVNFITPWELIRVLEERGWQVGEQWGTYDAIADDRTNVAADLDVANLPLPIQQAAATVWSLIAAIPD